jgi:hypothetical protein
MTASINASTSSGLVLTSDLSGSLNLQSNGTTVATVASTGFSLPTNNTLNAANTFGFKNRLINGNMVIDQRNAGASVTVNNGSSNFFIADRWFANGENSDGVYTGQQVTTAPTGFNNSLKFTVTTADTSIGATQAYVFRQRIEGYNFADLGWGTANAKTITISFWVQSSLTGNFGGSLFNGNGDRAYAFSFSISSANTWEQKTITIAGDTTGTWNTTNGTGLNLTFSLGVGSSYKGTAGSWGSTFYFAPTGSIDLISTNGATFYITGTQLEIGSQATSFDFRDYGRELILCQRYYQTNFTGTPIVMSGGFNGLSYTNSVDAYGMATYKVSMRATPTVVLYDSSNNVGCCVQVGQAAGIAATAGNITFTGFNLVTRTTGTFATTASTNPIQAAYTASAEL